MSPSEKQHHTDRYRGGLQFIERWTAAKAAFIGYWAGRGYSYQAIAERLADGTSPATIRRMRRLWKLPARDGIVSINIDMTVRERAHLFSRAAQHNLPPEEFGRLLLTWATMPKDRFLEIVPKDPR